MHLGKVVEHWHVCPNEAKIEAICHFTLPTNRHELCCFLGMPGYY